MYLTDKLIVSVQEAPRVAHLTPLTPANGAQPEPSVTDGDVTEAVGENEILLQDADIQQLSAMQLSGKATTTSVLPPVATAQPKVAPSLTASPPLAAAEQQLVSSPAPTVTATTPPTAVPGETVTAPPEVTVKVETPPAPAATPLTPPEPTAEEELSLDLVEKFVLTGGNDERGGTKHHLRIVEKFLERTLDIVAATNKQPGRWVKEAIDWVDVAYSIKKYQVEQARLRSERAHRTTAAETQQPQPGSEAEIAAAAAAQAAAPSSEAASSLPTGGAANNQALVVSLVPENDELRDRRDDEDDRHRRGDRRSASRSRRSERRQRSRSLSDSDLSGSESDRRRSRHRGSVSGRSRSGFNDRDDLSEEENVYPPWRPKSNQPGASQRGKCNVKIGVFKHGWPKIQVSASRLDLATFMGPIPDVDLQVIKNQPHIMFTATQFRSQEGEMLSMSNVFKWVKAMLKAMQVHNTHPHTMAKNIMEGIFMEPSRKAEIISEAESPSATNCQPLAFRAVPDRRDVAASVMWLQAILIWLMVNWGQGVKVDDAQDTINQLFMKTKSLENVYQLAKKIRQLQPMLPLEKRSHQAFTQMFEAALLRNPRHDKKQMLRDLNTQRKVEEMNLGLVRSEADFSLLSDEEKFTHTLNILKAIQDRTRSDASEDNTGE